MIFRFVVIRVSILIFSLSLFFECAVAEKRVIGLVAGSDYAPYVSSTLPEGGVVADVVRQVFTEMGYRSGLSFYPWNRAYQRVLNVQNDATFPYAWGAERASLFLYSRPVNRVNIRVFMNKRTSFDYAEALDLKGLVYCQPLGYQTEPELSDMIEQGKLIRFEARDMDGCFEMLIASRVDFVLSNDQVGWSSAERIQEQAGEKLIVAAEEPFRTISEYLIISKQHPDGERLIKEFNDAYEVLLDNGSLDRIWKHHLGEHASAVE